MVCGCAGNERSTACGMQGIGLNRVVNCIGFQDCLAHRAHLRCLSNGHNGQVTQRSYSGPRFSIRPWEMSLLSLPERIFRRLVELPLELFSVVLGSQKLARDKPGNPRFLVTRSPNGRGLSPIATGQHQICRVRPFLSPKAIFFWVLWAP